MWLGALNKQVRHTKSSKAKATTKAHGRPSGPANHGADTASSSLPAVGLDLLDVNPLSDHGRLLAQNHALSTIKPEPSTKKVAASEAEAPADAEPSPTSIAIESAPAQPPFVLTPDPIISLESVIGYTPLSVRCLPSLPCMHHDGLRNCDRLYRRAATSINTFVCVPHKLHHSHLHCRARDCSGLVTVPSACMLPGRSS